MTKITAALLKVQTDIGVIPKSESNPFFKSKYADLPAIMTLLQPKLTENGLVVTSACKDGNLRTEVIHVESGESVSSEFPIGNLTDPQKIGSAITYAKRYNIVALLNLICDQDDDGNSASNNGGSYASAPTSQHSGYEVLETVQDFVEAINAAKSISQLNALYYKWSAKFDPTSTEYTEVKKLSAEKKQQLGA